MLEQYSRRNNAEFSSIPNDIQNNQLEKKKLYRFAVRWV